jgi:hypothetical protein
MIGQGSICIGCIERLCKARIVQSGGLSLLNFAVIGRRIANLNWFRVEIIVELSLGKLTRSWGFGAGVVIGKGS